MPKNKLIITTYKIKKKTFHCIIQYYFIVIYKENHLNIMSKTKKPYS